MIQKNFRLSEDVCKQLENISSNENTSQSQLLEKIIMEYQPQEVCDGSAGTNYQKKKNDIATPSGLTDDDREILHLVKYIINDNNKKLFILTEVMNSLVSTALHCFPERFKSTTNPKEIHDWFLQANDTLQKIINEKMTHKKLRGD